MVTLAVMQYKGMQLEKAIPLLPRVATSMLAFCDANASEVCAWAGMAAFIMSSFFSPGISLFFC